MSDEVAALSAALAEVNELGRKLTAALEELNTHNSSSTAHEDIRKAVKDLIESGTIYTNDQIVEIVQSKLAAHANTDFKTAHPGWNEYSTNLEDRLTTMAADIVDLKSKIASQETTEPETELELKRESEPEPELEIELEPEFKHVPKPELKSEPFPEPGRESLK